MAKTLDLTELEIGSQIIFAGQTFKVDSFANMAAKGSFSITIHGVIEDDRSMGVGIEDPVETLPSPFFIPESPGEGYRFLEVGEKIQEGDEWYENGSGWQTTNADGDCVLPRDYTYRRKVNINELTKKYPAKAYFNGKLVNPGEGYRLLELGETINTGDEYLRLNGEWKETCCRGDDFVDGGDLVYRTKL